MNWTKVGARTALGAAAVLLGLYLLYLIRAVLIILVVSIIFAQAITPVVLRLRRFGARRAQAVLAIYLVIVVALAALGWFLVQALTSEAGALADAVPQMQQQLHQLAARIPIASLRGSIDSALSGEVQIGGSGGQNVPGEVLGTARTVFEAIFAIFTIFLITFYWISERLVIRRTMLRLLPEHHRERGLQVWDDVEDKLGAWVRGQLLVMLCIGLAFGIGLTAMRVKFSLLLAVFAAVAEIIPIVGPYIGTAAAVLVALSQGFPVALGVAIYGAIVQLVENNILVPRIMGRATGVSPLTVILGILIGTTLMGIQGALLAVPVAAAIQVLLVDLEILGGSAREPELPPKPATVTEPVETA